MAMPMFTRIPHVRNIFNSNSLSATGCALNTIQYSNTVSKPYSTVTNSGIKDVIPESSDKSSSKRISKAMKAYLERSRDYKQLITKEIAEYDIGKRHLANMMGEDPDQFTQKDIDKAIAYLFPSGLYDQQARPMMAHPTKLYENRKEAEFDESGRPHHFLFYTTKPNYYEILHKIASSLVLLNKMEDKKIRLNLLPTPEDRITTTGSSWLQKDEMEKKLLEYISDSEYEYLITCMERLASHPLSMHVSPLIMDCRKTLTSVIDNTTFPAPEYDSENRPFILVENCARKNVRGQVKVIGNGSGNITINGKDITYFNDIQCREQIIFPLIFTNMSDKVDVEATVSGGGPTGEAGAIRWGIAWALRSFVDTKMVEKMRIAGLLTRDWRKRERKKFGQEGARRKFTWKKR